MSFRSWAPLFFNQHLAEGNFLPYTKLRDLDGTTLSLKPCDSIPEAVRFLRDLQTFRGYRKSVLRHSLPFARRYRSRLTQEQLVIALANAALLCAASEVTAPHWSTWLKRRRGHRTFIVTSHDFVKPPETHSTSVGLPGTCRRHL